MKPLQAQQQKQTQTQTLAMTQQMEQSIKILELGVAALREYILGEALENPAIDIDELHTETPAALKRKKQEWLEQQALGEKKYVGYYDPDVDYSIEKTAPSHDHQSLQEYLTDQAKLLAHHSAYRALRFIIDYVDDDGYLRYTVPQLGELSGLDAGELEQAVGALQGFDPPGIGALDLRQCLLLQLEEGQALERELVQNHLELLAKGRTAKAAKELGISQQELEEAYQAIRRLNPRPGSAFSTPAPTVYITPDILVTTFADRYYVLPCDFAYPAVVMNAGMEDMLAQADDAETRRYIEEKVERVKWLQKCIAGRSETLLEVASCIVRLQEPFFLKGSQYLNVLRMQDVAAELGVHESTVSRAVKDKYLQCKHGVYPLRYFFVQGVKSEGQGGEISAHAVKVRLRRLIEGECGQHPLSDQKLTELLVGEGIRISRRTVAKYREQLGIPNSAQR